MTEITLDQVAKELEERWRRFQVILKSGCRCLVNTTTGETTECEVCKKARENIQ